jgi:hypothetical protein
VLPLRLALAVGLPGSLCLRPLLRHGLADGALQAVQAALQRAAGAAQVLHGCWRGTGASCHGNTCTAVGKTGRVLSLAKLARTLHAGCSKRQAGVQAGLSCQP